MLNFKNFYALPAKRKYIALLYSRETQENLMNWCMDQGVDLTVSYDGKTQSPNMFDFHTTIFFSTSKHVIPNGVTVLSNPIYVKPTGLQYLGEDEDIPVINVYSDTLLHLRRKFEKDYKMKDEWPEYHSHISISYNKEHKPNITSLPTFPLIGNMIKVEDIK